MSETKSRSVRRREAVMRGEPMPTFQEGPMSSAAETERECESLREEVAAMSQDYGTLLAEYHAVERRLATIQAWAERDEEPRTNYQQGRQDARDDVRALLTAPLE